MLHYIAQGKGDKQIIFVHGNSQSSKVWAKVFNIDHLKSYKLIALDLPGHGKSLRSSKSEEDYSLHGMGNHVLNVLKEFEKQPYLLVGNSLGSNIIGEIALRLKNCKGVLFTGSCAIGKGLGLEDIFLPNPDASFGFMEHLSEEQLNAMIDATGNNFGLDDRNLIKQEFRNTDGKMRLELAQAISGAKYSDELQNLEDSKIPLAIVFGEDEKLCNISYFNNINLPKWKNEIKLIKNSGHFPHLDQPEALSNIINEFATHCF